ncbi:MGMT family protein [Kaistella carnis]|uniref:MGMT family protein n=1 Tax=Kaistella carnis TaxID=1241979 RepID=UPI0028AED771|nr:MGMT family protein [Kaistella carnis]
MNELFKKQVFEIIMMIPEGRVTSYGAIAKAVGYTNHARHVGNALRNYEEIFRLTEFVILRVRLPQVVFGIL